VFSIIVENRHNGWNEHGVPQEKLEQMKTRFEIKLEEYGKRKLSLLRRKDR